MRLLIASLAAAAVAAVAPGEGTAGLVRLDGSFASADLVVADPDGCRQSRALFTAYEQSHRGQPGQPTRSQFLFLSFDVFDYCANRLLFASYSAHQLQPGSLVLDAKRGAASLDVTVELADGLGSGETKTLTFKLFWHGEAKPWLDSRFRSRSRAGKMFVLVTGKTQFYDAVLLGSVSDGANEYLDGAISNVLLGESSDGVLIAPDALAVAAASAQLAAAGGPTRSILRHEYSWAVSIWEAFDDTGCIRRLGLAVIERSAVDKSDPGTSGYFDFSEYDHCANEPRFWISTDGVVPVEDGAFELRSNRESAIVSTVVDATDRVGGRRVPLAIDVTWTGVGPISRDSSSSHVTIRGVRETGHSSQVSRTGEVSGEILASGSNLISGFPVGPADLVSASFGSGSSTTRTRP